MENSVDTIGGFCRVCPYVEDSMMRSCIVTGRTLTLTAILDVIFGHFG